MNDYTAEQYIADVGSGKQVACKWIKLAVKRHLDDLKRAEEKAPDFPYYFDAECAKRVIDYVQQLRHTKGEWADPRRHDTRIRLEPWQQFELWVLYGWRREGGYRRFTRAYIEIARKNGKTTKAAALANFAFTMDRPREIGAEVYCVATKRDQAKIAWEEACRQLQANTYLREKVKVFKTAVTVPGTAAKMVALGRDSKMEDGANPHFVLVDEYHAHPDNGMLEVMDSAIVARQQPLTYIITTAGFDINSPCYQEEHRKAEATLERSITPVPESFFALIYTLDEDDDWADRSVWVKANPNIGVSVQWEKLAERVQEALLSPTKQNDVLTKNFNRWCHAVSRWVTHEAWQACDGKVSEAALAGQVCYGGLDLSSSIDITAFALCFPPFEGSPHWSFLWRFWIPEADLLARVRRDKVPYDYWIREGLIQTTPGNVVDTDFIEEQIRKDLAKFQVKEIGFDPWKAGPLVTHLSDENVTMVPIRQAYSGMAAPTDLMEKRILARELAHGGNPVAAWMLSCCEPKSDRQGNVMLMKPKRETYGKRIDGIVAAIMALDRANRNEGGASVYEKRGALVVG